MGYCLPHTHCNSVWLKTSPDGSLLASIDSTILTLIETFRAFSTLPETQHNIRKRWILNFRMKVCENLAPLLRALQQYACAYVLCTPRARNKPPVQLVLYCQKKARVGVNVF